MSISQNIHAIQQRIKESALRANRAPEDVRLIAVSKTFPTEDIAIAYNAGQVLFGENKVQEGLTKAPLLPTAIEWHLIGPLQRNKVRKALGIFSYFHAIDSLKLAQYMNTVAEEMNIFPKVLFEINIGNQESKFGFSPEEIQEQWQELISLKNICPQGLMSIPPLADTEETARHFFSQLRKLRDILITQPNSPTLPELSMGMSSDFEFAIAEGATFVRVGTSIFGGR